MHSLNLPQKGGCVLIQTVNPQLAVLRGDHQFPVVLAEFEGSQDVLGVDRVFQRQSTVVVDLDRIPVLAHGREQDVRVCGRTTERHVLVGGRELQVQHLGRQVLALGVVDGDGTVLGTCHKEVGQGRVGELGQGTVELNELIANTGLLYVEYS